MIDLFLEKHKAVDNLKNFTREILLLSAKTDDTEISLMITQRQKYIDDILLLDKEIEKNLKSNQKNYIEDEIKSIKDNIRDSISEIMIMDKEIRKNVNAELKNVKDKLNQPKSKSSLFNMRI